MLSVDPSSVVKRIHAALDPIDTSVAFVPELSVAVTAVPTKLRQVREVSGVPSSAIVCPPPAASANPTAPLPSVHRI